MPLSACALGCLLCLAAAGWGCTQTGGTAPQSSDAAEGESDAVSRDSEADVETVKDGDTSPSDGGAAPEVPEVTWEDEYPDDCQQGLKPAAMADCGERRYWQAFQVEMDRRQDVYELLGEVIGAVEKAESPPKRKLARLYFRRGQMGLALVLEQQNVAKIGELVPDFERALEIAPDYDIVPPWMDAVEIAKAALQNDWDSIASMREDIWRHVDRAPMENTLSISGTTIGLPRSTGLPADTLERLEEWECSGEPWCDRNTKKAPFARPGLNYHIAESYARMGKRQKAKKYLDKTLEAPGADQWPFRPLAKRARDDLGNFIHEFEKLGEDGSGFRDIYANKEYGCMFCHSPASAVPDDVVPEQ